MERNHAGYTRRCEPRHFIENEVHFKPAFQLTSVLLGIGTTVKVSGMDKAFSIPPHDDVTTKVIFQNLNQCLSFRQSLTVSATCTFFLNENAKSGRLGRSAACRWEPGRH